MTEGWSVTNACCVPRACARLFEATQPTVWSQNTTMVRFTITIRLSLETDIIHHIQQKNKEISYRTTAIPAISNKELSVNYTMKQTGTSFLEESHLSFGCQTFARNLPQQKNSEISCKTAAVSAMSNKLLAM